MIESVARLAHRALCPEADLADQNVHHELAMEPIDVERTDADQRAAVLLEDAEEMALEPVERCDVAADHCDIELERRRVQSCERRRLQQPTAPIFGRIAAVDRAQQIV